VQLFLHKHLEKVDSTSTGSSDFYSSIMFRKPPVHRSVSAHNSAHSSTDSMATQQHPQQRKRSGKLSLLRMLTAPFILQVFTLTSLVGYLSYRDGQQAIADLTNQLMADVSQRVEQKLTSYLASPQLANQMTSNAVVRGDVTFDFDRPDARRDQHLWQTMQLFPNLTWISWGSEDGSTLGIWRPKSDQPLQISTSNRSTQYYGNYYATQNGTRGQLLKVETPAYDPRPRPWYREAIAAKKQTWTKIYEGFTPGTIFIAASQPLYDRSGKLVGVSGTDLAMEGIQSFLRQNRASPTGEIVLIERSGLLVASSSSQERIFQKVGDQSQRLHVLESKTPLVQETATSILAQVGDFKTIRQRQTFELTLNHQKRFVQTLPYVRSDGLDWLIVIIVPEADVMSQIHDGTRQTVLLCLGAVGAVILLNAVLSRRITQPIKSLNQASQNITQGNFQNQVADSQIREISNLATSFNQMSQEIQQSRQQLEEYSRSLEQKVHERTQALQDEVQRRANAETALQSANVELTRLAYLDGLTQIANRRLFDERLQQEWLRLKRDQRPLSIILCDVDYFKQYNDTYGHQLGDECLQKVAQAIASVPRRSTDLVARYGGEEFVILLANTNLAGALNIAQRAQVQVKLLQLPHRQSKVSQYVTASFGVASVIPDESMTPQQVVMLADQALYQAKIEGRDRVVVKEEESGIT
jgi:diguanylate cyclase (GGDEF)-like protein